VVVIVVYELVNEKFCEAGGEDGLGTIILPRKLEKKITFKILNIVARRIL
jgi:hypothetical protein